MCGLDGFCGKGSLEMAEGINDDGVVMIRISIFRMNICDMERKWLKLYVLENRIWLYYL